MNMSEEMNNENNPAQSESQQGNDERENQPDVEIDRASGSAGDATSPEQSAEAKESVDEASRSVSGETGIDDELEKLRKEAADMKDAWSRERAEFMNFKKRVSQEQARLRIQAVAGFVKELLPVLDNLNRVVSASAEDPALKDFITGVEMIRSEFMSVLEKEKIKRFSPVEEAFDPSVMEAIAMEEQESLSQDTVLEVYQDGFFLESESGGRQVIRPARVKVGKPASVK